MPIIGMSGASVMLLPVLEALQVAVDLEFRAFELFAEFPQCVCDDVTQKQREEGRLLVEDSGLTLAVHAPFTSLNIAGLNRGIRAESVRQTLAAIDLCADMGGKVVTVHNGKNILSRRYRKKSPEAFEVQWNYNIESLKRAAGRAQERGIIMCLENIGFEADCIDRNVDDMLKIRDQVGSPALAFCMDIGHARLNDELPQAVEKMGPHTRHIHFTDNFGERDDHLIIGEGNFDYSPHLDFFKNFDDILLLEVFSISTDPSPARASLEYVKKLLGLDT